MATLVDFVKGGVVLLCRIPVILRGLAPGVADSDAVVMEQFNAVNNANAAGMVSDLFIQNTQLQFGREATIPTGHIAVSFADYTVNGDLHVEGDLYILDPTTLL